MLYDNLEVIIDYLFHTLILFAISLLNGYSLLIKFITTDGVLSAYHYLKLYLNKNVTDSQIVHRSSLLYNYSVFDRYIFYTLEYILYKILCGIFWTSDISIFYYTIFVTLIPPILNKLMASSAFGAVLKKKEELVGVVLAKQVAFLIRTLSKIYLHKDADIKHKDILPLLSDYIHAVAYTKELVKNIGIILLLVYIKNQSTSFYYLSKHIYNYFKATDSLVSFNTETAKIMLSDIIDRKEWGELLKPNTCKAILHLYQTNEDNDDMLKKIITDINFKFGKTCVIWTLSYFFENIYIGPILSCILLLYRFKKSGETLKTLGLLVGLCVFAPVIKYIPIMSVLCQFGYILIFNKVVYAAIEFAYRTVRNFASEVFVSNMAYNTPMLFLSANVLLFGYMQTVLMLLVICGYTMFVSMVLDIKINFMFYLILVLNSVSNFNVLHLVFLLLVLYTALGAPFMRSVKMPDFVNLFRTLYHRRRVNSVVFEIMDIDRFPSASDINRIKNISVPQIEKNDKINTQPVISVIEKDDIFDLPDSNFLDAISVDDDNETDASTITVKKITEPFYVDKEFIH
jgi:hypothetical protein